MDFFMSKIFEFYFVREIDHDGDPKSYKKAILDTDSDRCLKVIN